MDKGKIFIIAEAGVNHNGSLETAKKMIDAAASSGADAVKFQTFRAENIATSEAPKAEYQKKNTKREVSQLEMLKKLELDRSAHKELIKHCKEKGIIFLSTPFDLDSVGMLNELGLEMFKVPSGEITNLPYLRKIGGLSKKIILSTGMSELFDIENALNVFIETGTPKENITVLHCNTAYPTPPEDANLTAMVTVRDALGVKVGYSDHTLGIETAIAAAALGAKIIEKHFTLDNNMEGPDHVASLEPGQLKAMVDAIRNIEKAMGGGIKKRTPSEEKNMPVVRKSLVASKFIKKGDLFTEENITVKRPATGIDPMKWDNVMNSPAKRDFKQDEVIEI